MVVQTLVKNGIDLPCTVTIDDGAVHRVVTSTRASRTHGMNTPNESFMISTKFPGWRWGDEGACPCVDAGWRARSMSVDSLTRNRARGDYLTNTMTYGRGEHKQTRERNQEKD
jgi:hypothetical protein